MLSSSTNLPVYDAEALRDHITKLKITLAERKAEKESLAELVAVKEKQALQLRQEYTVLAPDDDLRWQPTEELSQSVASVTGSRAGATSGVRESKDGAGSVAGSVAPSIDNSRFQMLNDKLEMQILIPEIRIGIAQLEQEVRVWEEMATRESKKVQKQAKASFMTQKRDAATPGDEVSRLYKDTAQLESEIEELLTKVLELKTERRMDIDRERKVNESLSKEIAQLRRDLDQTMREEVSLSTSVIELKCQGLVEGKSAEKILTEFITVRERLNDFHNGFGWQTDVYLTAVGKSYILSFYVLVCM